MGKFRQILRTLWMFSLCLWAPFIIALSVNFSYADVFNPTLIFFEGMFVFHRVFSFVIIPTLIIGIIVIPVVLIIKGGLSIYQKNLKSAAMFFAIPCFGLALYYSTYEISKRLFINIQINQFMAQIQLAITNNRDVSENGVTIDRGPPVTARFRIPTMLFGGSQDVLFDETDKAADPENLNIDCGERSRPLGRHFFRIDSDC